MACITGTPEQKSPLAINAPLGHYLALPKTESWQNVGGLNNKNGHSTAYKRDH
jgi:hypothetical protein